MMSKITVNPLKRSLMAESKGLSSPPAPASLSAQRMRSLQRPAHAASLSSPAGQHDMVVLHLDNATDSKALLGSYVCGDTPGEFRWQPGALAQALSAGRWVLLEDVDAAPADVMTSLVPLLEGRPLAVPGRGESLAPAPGFALFGSVTSRVGAPRELASPGLWARVQMTPPPASELAAILGGLYPHDAALVGAMLASLSAARRLCGQSSGEGSDAPAPPRAASPGRELTLRDVVKWGHRMRTLHGGCMQPGAPLTPLVRELAFMEGADLLAGMLPCGAGRDALLGALADAWEVPRERAQHYDALHKPALALAAGALSVGRVALSVHSAASAAAGGGAPTGGFALTGHACRQLERLAAAVACTEPVLLVGETGAGKTAAVQALARAAGARLVVVNMSTQSDSADLVGGFKPREPGTLCLPLAATFAALFSETFPRDANAEFAARVVRPQPSAALLSRARAPSPPTTTNACGA